MIKTVAFIFARGGSKGLPKKNILKIGGIPLIAHSIKLALSMIEVDAVYVSTDCAEIASIANEFGANVIKRPPELATDVSPEWLSWQHAINFVQTKLGSFDRFLSLPATAPLRSGIDVRNCLEALSPGIDMVITVTPAHRNPWFNMVSLASDRQASLLINEGSFTSRQHSPKCFDMTTVAYVARPDFILEHSNLWDGTVIGVQVPQERSIDIDNELDFTIAGFLMSKYKSSL
jgi:CMP-N-acetylneuraminic acid synthetase